MFKIEQNIFFVHVAKRRIKIFFYNLFITFIFDIR